VALKKNDITLRPIGLLKSDLREVKKAPCQGSQGAPEAWIVINENVTEGMKDIQVNDRIIVLTWLHLGNRSVLSVHPQDNPKNPLTSVFATRSADRPNPIGLHPVTVLEVTGNKIRVAPIEAIDGTPVVDIKPVI
jgi:tRNA-Thr(GGU) m(6)t(6)A37 methyltransferase TsaA